VPVISDSSPLILYEKAGYLHLMPALFGSIVIPPAVYDEVVTANPQTTTVASPSPLHPFTAFQHHPPHPTLPSPRRGGG
jgi:predicted nucleic acid-binding protein